MYQNIVNEKQEDIHTKHIYKCVYVCVCTHSF